MTGADLIRVEVVYALPDRQVLIPLRVARGTTAREAVKLSGIELEFPRIDLGTCPMGIFSRHLDGRDLPLPDDYVLRSKDRVELYRPLLLDPKQARLARAVKPKK